MQDGRVTARFDAEAKSAGAARRLVTTTLGGWRCGELAYEAALLTSELVANAVRHAHSEVDVRLSRTASGIRIEVDDYDPHPLAPRRPGPDDTGGRGLYLVGALARDWGVRFSPPGKTVWFELDLVDQQGKRNVVVDLRDMTVGDGADRTVRGCDARVAPCTTPPRGEGRAG